MDDQDFTGNFAECQAYLERETKEHHLRVTVWLDGARNQSRHLYTARLRVNKGSVFIEHNPTSETFQVCVEQQPRT